MENRQQMMKWVRMIVAFGLLAYMVSFFFLSSSHTLFYFLVAFPTLLVCPDFRELFQQDKRVFVISVLCFVAYMAFSSLWSDEGKLMNGLKLAFCITVLLMAVHSTVNTGRGFKIRNFMLIVGCCAICFYFVSFLGEMLFAEKHTSLLLSRFTLHMLNKFGSDNPINTATYSGLVALTVWWSFPKGRILEKIGFLFVMIVSLAIMFLSKSRGPILSLFITLVMVSVFRRSKHDLVLWTFLLVSGVSLVAIFDLMPIIANRVEEPNYRFGIWLGSLEQIKNNLFFGLGFDSSVSVQAPETHGSVLASHSHSSVLETFRIGGLAGGTLFLVMSFSAIYRGLASRTLLKNEESLFFISWLIFGILCLSTNGRSLIRGPSVEWFAFWIPLFFLAFSGFDSGRTQNISKSHCPPH